MYFHKANLQWGSEKESGSSLLSPMHFLPFAYRSVVTYLVHTPQRHTATCLQQIIVLTPFSSNIALRLYDEGGVFGRFYESLLRAFHFHVFENVRQSLVR